MQPARELETRDRIPCEMLPTSVGDMTSMQNLRTSWIRTRTTRIEAVAHKQFMRLGFERMEGMQSSLPLSTAWRGLLEQGLPEILKLAWTGIPDGFCVW